MPRRGTGEERADAINWALAPRISAQEIASTTALSRRGATRRLALHIIVAYPEKVARRAETRNYGFIEGRGKVNITSRGLMIVMNSRKSKGWPRSWCLSDDQATAEVLSRTIYYTGRQMLC